MARRRKRKPTKSRHRWLFPPLVNGDDEEPEDMDEFRNQMARRIRMVVSTATNTWQDCPEPACRRHRCCMAPNMTCTNAPPPNLSKEEGARIIAKIYQALRERVAQEGEEA